MPMRYEETPLQEARRIARWRHFALIGSIRFFQSHLSGFHHCPTVTDEAKAMAAEVNEKLDKLLELMKTRNPREGIAPDIEK